MVRIKKGAKDTHTMTIATAFTRCQTPRKMELTCTLRKALRAIDPHLGKKTTWEAGRR
jgi:hypothetical protein